MRISLSINNILVTRRCITTIVHYTTQANYRHIGDRLSSIVQIFIVILEVIIANARLEKRFLSP